MIIKVVDINCDVGEEMPAEEYIMPYITSANIACGFHAGGEVVMRRTIDLAKHYKIKIGAHPSFQDKANFGRIELNLPADDIYTLVIQQLVKIDLIVKEKELRLHHVKPHGALYNMAARDEKIAEPIIQAVKDYNDDLVVYGLSGSKLIEVGNKMGLKTANEVFADRGYEDDGSLVSRNKDGALLTDENEVVNRVLKMVHEGWVLTTSGKQLAIDADTICLHGDGKNALKLAKAIYKAIYQNTSHSFTN